MSTNKVIAFAASLVATIAIGSAAGAQSVNSKATEKARWYTAPHEVQILDERPVIKDFREAPAAQEQIQLPPAPPGYGAGGGGGSGALGSGGPTLPPGGNMGARNGGPALPSAAFGSRSNLGNAGRAALPNGNSTGIHAKQAVPVVARSSPRSTPAYGDQVPRRPQTTASYGGGYGPSTGSSSGNSSSSTAVHASLLKKVR